MVAWPRFHLSVHAVVFVWGWMDDFPEQGLCYSSLLNQSPVRSEFTTISAGPRGECWSFLFFFYIWATFEECYSDFLLQPWHPSYSTVWATSTSSKYLGNLSWVKNLFWVLCLSFFVTPTDNKSKWKIPTWTPWRRIFSTTSAWAPRLTIFHKCLETLRWAKRRF